MTNTTKTQTTTTAQAEGFLTSYNKRVAEMCEALGMTEHAADARARQASMLRHLHEDALAENRNRSL
jgi:hypothetical protein